jgi:hypothetical protein
MMASEDLLDCFRIPMSRRAYNEFLELQIELTNLASSLSDENDKWTFIWGNQNYSSSRFYQYHFRAIQPHRSVLWVWKTKCVQKIKVFGWLLLNDRLNTRNILRRRKKFLEEGYNCVMCQEGVEETTDHLFFKCSSAVSRWFALGITWNDNANIHQRIYMAKEYFHQPFFMEVFLVGAWCLWNERNGFIFNNKVPNFASWKAAVKTEVSAHLIRIKHSLHSSILQWLDAL